MISDEEYCLAMEYGHAMGHLLGRVFHLLEAQVWLAMSEHPGNELRAAEQA